MTSRVLRALRALNPHPEPEASDGTGLDPSAEALMARIAASDPAPRPAAPRGRRARRGTTGAVALAALVLAGGALAAVRWGVADLPPAGDGGGPEAFVLPATDILPGGYERTRPPAIDELPVRPSLLFPADVGHAEAVRRYFAARVRGAILPPGVELAAPLPEGKAVLVREDGRVALDPAAPLGYVPATGLVRTLSGEPRGADPIARCQLLLGLDDPRSPACDAPGPAETTWVREGVDGRWLPSENPGLPEQIVGTTELSVLDRPATPADRLPARVLARLSGRDGHRRADPASVRLATEVGGQRLFVVPIGPDGVCLVVSNPDRSQGSTCGARSTLTDRGAIALSGSDDGVRYHYAALVGDGFDTATTDGGLTVPITGNAFALDLSPGVETITVSGRAGRFELDLLGHGPGSIPGHVRGTNIPLSAVRAQARRVVTIRLSDGTSQGITVAPSRDGGRCAWSHTFSTCDPRPRIPYDVVTLGFISGLPGVPVVYSGELAPAVAAVAVRYADGRSERLQITEGWVLHEFPPQRLTLATMPVAVTTFDHAGVALVRQELDLAPIVRQRTR